MSKLQMLRAFVNQRLTSAVEEIFVLFERTVTEYEDEVSRSKEENERQRKLLDAVMSPEVRLHGAVFPADVQQLLVQQEWSSNVKQEDPESPHIKDEQEELWSHQDGEQFQGLEDADIIKISSTPDPIKSESDEEEAQFFQLHQSQTEENREAEPPASSSAELMKTEADKEDCEGPAAAWNLDSACEDNDSDPSESGTDNGNDRKETREPQSCLKTLKNKQVPLNDMGCYKVKKCFICSECDRRFDCKSFLIRHMRIHTGEKPFICSICGKNFTRKEHVTSHMQVHSGEKPFRCSICGKRFTRKTHLAVHTRSHSGEKRFRCSVCGKGFNQKSHLAVHMRIHLGEKPFSCLACGKRFTHKSSLVIHMRLHSAEKPFRCPVCGKRFTQKTHLTIHMRHHSGEKPFSCLVCGKTFTQKTHLTIHLRHHSGEKPFSCSVCGKRFTHKSSLSRHLRIHSVKFDKGFASP